jgi:hypothetical protein
VPLLGPLYRKDRFEDTLLRVTKQTSHAGISVLTARETVVLTKGVMELENLHRDPWNSVFPIQVEPWIFLINSFKRRPTTLIRGSGDEGKRGPRGP